MLTKRQNFIETIKGGNPDRFVNQFEFLSMVPNPIRNQCPPPAYGGEPKYDIWGVLKAFPLGTPGPFPVHTEEHIVIKDIDNWRDYLKFPNTKISDAEWEPVIAAAEAIDRNETYCTVTAIPGVFEQTHYLLEIQRALMAFYESPDEMKELIDVITDYEMALAEEYCTRIKPDALFKHDDWGSQISTFLSPDMFEEFYLDSYKKIYGYYKSHGVEIIVHHSDSYAATYVPFMIDMGMDVWQGVMNTNDIPSLIEKYGGQIAFMGGIDSATVDYEGWTEDIVREQVRKACDACGTKYFIPCGSQGGAMSTFPGVYEAISKEIDDYSKIIFK